jgi:hypothetical protein
MLWFQLMKYVLKYLLYFSNKYYLVVLRAALQEYARSTNTIKKLIMLLI